MPREAASHNLTGSTLDTLAFYLVKIRPWGRARETLQPFAAPKVKTLPSCPMASTAKFMHGTQTMEGSGPWSEKRIESQLVSQLPVQRHRGGARVPQQGSQWGKKS